MSTITELATRTPTTRLRHVDLLRAVAIIAVVLGHWLLMTVERTADGRLIGYTALPQLADVHHLTWVFQVMPLFFLVGGFANAISWNRHQGRGRDAGSWLLDRSRRVFPPMTVLLLTVAVGALVAGQAGVYARLLTDVVAVVVLPLWFLVVYLAVILLTPVMLRLHRRFGLRVVAVMLAVVVVGDVLRLTTGLEGLASASSVFGWLAMHQTGFAWQDGSLRLTARRAALLFAGAVAALLLLTGVGPYPVSMVSVPGAAMQNPSPPSVALMVLATAQLALAVLVSGPAERWMARRRPWAFVVGLNGVALTLFLWHMVAAFVGALLLDVAGWLPSADVGSSAWWLGRVPWLLTLTVVMGLLVVTVGRMETRILLRKAAAPAGASRPAVSLPLVAGCYLAAVGGMLWLAASGPGPHGIFKVPTGALALVLAASAVLAVARARASSGRATASAAPAVER
ncbi:acyltransferase 3 [Xylanimonas cellulosilytica DSM 15894]|uniref:Acyltransferase 3 n=1 Tax=Xylanimonas cellulosilytica (strain DSM 15894 / JCM 12276 / CECT 5975 / KCTC 9989 / LMG 20990 / NBRC 107835 / XIL07) TaxID=446471 RepID=D1BUA0_XYLCX|nr:acyltransferase [Xylanimonas cellulosilytica]ACZ31113.1 acyltransferase 3 [Xylanimonas cellulosilytica DSM 15894]